MRSRYTAFALGLEAYLLRSWHPSTRPNALELDPEIEWQRLFIEQSSAGGPFDESGEVTFTAVAHTPDGLLRQRECSRFARDGEGRWCYVDGTAL
jgi:SEC-C motif-containing protein